MLSLHSNNSRQIYEQLIYVSRRDKRGIYLSFKKILKMFQFKKLSCMFNKAVFTFQGLTLTLNSIQIEPKWVYLYAIRVTDL